MLGRATPAALIPHIAVVMTMMFLKIVSWEITLLLGVLFVFCCLSVIFNNEVGAQVVDFPLNDDGS